MPGNPASTGYFVSNVAKGRRSGQTVWARGGHRWERGRWPARRFVEVAQPCATDFQLGQSLILLRKLGGQRRRVQVEENHAQRFRTSRKQTGGVAWQRLIAFWRQPLAYARGSVWCFVAMACDQQNPAIFGKDLTL